MVHDADPAADAAALERLAVWMQRRYSPLVATDLPDGLQLDITGCAHLFGGEKDLLKEMIRRLAGVSIDARAAAAPSYGAGYALERCAANPIFILPTDQVSRALSLLLVSALRLSDPIVAALKQLGFERIGELDATPRAPLALRFGPSIGERLDQAYDRLAVRLGMNMVAGLSNAEGAALLVGRADQPFADVEDAWRRGGTNVSSLVRLAEADAFHPSMGLARRDALWAIKALRDTPFLSSRRPRRTANLLPRQTTWRCT